MHEPEGPIGNSGCKTRDYVRTGESPSIRVRVGGAMTGRKGEQWLVLWWG